MKFYLEHDQFEQLQLYIRNILNLYFEDAYLFEGQGDNCITININQERCTIVTTTLTIDGNTYTQRAERKQTDKRAMKPGTR